MQKSLSAAIIGAGSIGGLIDTPKSSNTASHAHAYTKESSCSLVAICEPDKNNQNEFKKRWGELNTYENSSELFEKENIDILSISSPTKFHAKNLKEALHVNTISHILCEKPLVENQKELDELKTELELNDKKILINLIRRYDPSFIQLQTLINEKKWGKILDFHGTFTKGLLHNGIHMLAVLSHLLGCVNNVKPLHVNKDFLVECDNVKGTLTCIENIDYSIFELDIIFEHAKVEIKKGGTKISIYEKTPSPLYENYFTLTHKETLKNTLQHYASNSLSFLLKENSSTCKAILKEHIKLHEIIYEVIK
ncbi:Gfo/Idh/MocA family protein [Sulfurospirillum arcachonense]|uniref:Gfo/Idh/MocA family protein n=1 Tax=Sulfurospirillum arcachonense TaxID=57666 RepID=UPI000469D4DF|nr:Gfo/Idh/MocA family oxidoreductase [Sulfurospirillum arcachonense]